jgi:hypothetical protein
MAVSFTRLPNLLAPADRPPHRGIIVRGKPLSPFFGGHDEAAEALKASVYRVLEAG